MTDPMDSPRPATTKLHRKLKDRMYRHAEKHNLTGFEAAGVMLALATEVMASALVRDGLLRGGPDWAEEGEGDADAAEPLTNTDPEPPEADPQARIRELVAETLRLSKGWGRMNKLCDELTEANAKHLARIAQLEAEAKVMRNALEESREVERQAGTDGDRVAQLEDALREMAKLAIDEIGARARVIKPAGPLFTGSIEKQKEAEGSICERMEVVTHWLGVKNILKRCGLTLPTQEPQP